MVRVILNDSYRTDVVLFYPPFMIALAALHIVSQTLSLPELSSFVLQQGANMADVSATGYDPCKAEYLED